MFHFSQNRLLFAISLIEFSFRKSLKMHESSARFLQFRPHNPLSKWPFFWRNLRDASHSFANSYSNSYISTIFIFVCSHFPVYLSFLNPIPRQTTQTFQKLPSLFNPLLLLFFQFPTLKIFENSGGCVGDLPADKERKRCYRRGRLRNEQKVGQLIRNRTSYWNGASALQ